MRHGVMVTTSGERRWMLSEIVRSGACQNLRATKGGTTATQATTIQ